MLKKHQLIVSAFFIIIICLFAIDAQAVSFDPNNIISDEEMLDASSMSLSDIQTFLSSKGGYIANHSFASAYGPYKTAAEIIYNAANNYDCETSEMYRALNDEEKAKFCEPATINPKLLLVLLQKEQSLIEEKTPTQKQLDWATGYG
ncbi:MAG: hypothetical protein U9R06_02835, partial [Patescibacteria group bacterium]|nr:hypothetical protein [Patescibacteria group bacterium]